MERQTGSMNDVFNNDSNTIMYAFEVFSEWATKDSITASEEGQLLGTLSNMQAQGIQNGNKLQQQIAEEMSKTTDSSTITELNAQLNVYQAECSNMTNLYSGQTQGVTTAVSNETQNVTAAYQSLQPLVDVFNNLSQLLSAAY